MQSSKSEKTTPGAEKEGKSHRAGFLGRLFGRKKKQELTAANRRHIRHSCWSVGTVSIINRSMALEGVVTEIAKGGVKFRPAKVYLLERNGVQISAEFGGLKVVGKIVATRADGYGIAFFEELDDDKIQAFLAEFGKAPRAH